MPARHLGAIAAIAALVCAVPVHSQVTFSSRALAVRVDVLVTDGHRPVAGLTASDFELRDNGVLQKIAVADAADAPLNAMLALDSSGSITGKRRSDLIDAGEALLDGLTAADRAALTTFNFAAVPTVGWTSNLADVRTALRAMEPVGLTAVMDGVYVALMSTVDQPGRFLVVVCTDGTDTASWLLPDDVLQLARRSNAVVYAVTAAAANRPEALERLVETTGGQVMPITSTGQLRETFQRILVEFRSRYVLAYSPQGVAGGGFHRIEVTVPGRHVTVRARPGYAGAPGGRP